MPQLALLESSATSIAFTAAAPATSGSGRQLSDYRSRLLRKLGNRGDVTSTDLDRYINDGYKKLCADADLDELRFSIPFDLVDAQPLYLLHENIELVSHIGWRSVDSAGNTLEQKLMKIDLDTFRRLPEEEGSPRAFFRFKQLIVLYPTPDEIITCQIEGRMIPEILVQDTDRCIFGPRFEQVIQHFAAYYAHDELAEIGLATASLNAGVAELRGILNRAARDREGVVAGVSIPRSIEELNQLSAGTV